MTDQTLTTGRSLSEFTAQLASAQPAPGGGGAAALAGAPFRRAARDGRVLPASSVFSRGAPSVPELPKRAQPESGATRASAKAAPNAPMSGSRTRAGRRSLA